MGDSPITPENLVLYQAFIKEDRADFLRIARATRGEYSAEDVSQQALLMAWELQTGKGLAMRFADADYRRLLLSHLYPHFLRYTETAVRSALRYRRRYADDGQLELLAEVLPADESYDPLHVLDPGPARAQADPDAQLSQASAWLFLVGHSGNEVRRLAGRLLISVSHCYHCLARARGLARQQHPLPILCTGHDGLPLQPRGWRRFRYERRPTQLQFAFVTEPTLWRGNAGAPG